MPSLVDANGMNSQAPLGRAIPPPLGAAIMPTPRTAPMGTPQYPWGIPFPQYVQLLAFQIHCSASPCNHRNYTFPAPQDPYAAWRQWCDTTAHQQQSGPSPYIPRQPLNPEPQLHNPPHRPSQQSSFRKKSNSVHIHLPWPSSQGDLSPLDLHTRIPDVQAFTPRALDMHTPSSSLSHSISSSGPSIPPGMYHERPQQWRHDFKFKSGFASMFRNKSGSTRAVDGRSPFLSGTSRN